jgi:hypothetical protein
MSNYKENGGFFHIIFMKKFKKMQKKKKNYE